METKLVGAWREALKTDHGRKDFLESGLQRACALLRTTSLNGGSLDLLTHLLRLLRDTISLGQVAVAGILRGGVAEAVALLVCCGATALREGDAATIPFDAQRGPDVHRLAVPTADDSNLIAACAQLLANLASSGSAGAEAVWASCWPRAFVQLVNYHADKVHGPATLALYACCCRDVRRSRALCGGDSGGSGGGSCDSGCPDAREAELRVASSATVSCASAGTAPLSTSSPATGCAAGPCAAAGGVADSACDSAGGAGDVVCAAGERRVESGSRSNPSESGASGGGSGGTAARGAAARAIWSALLGRLVVGPEQGAAAPPLTAADSGGDGRGSGGGRGGGDGLSGGGGRAGGGVSGGGECTALLCGCVALRQGLLRPLLSLLHAAPGAGGGAPARGPLAPLGAVLLHVLAQELQDLHGSREVDVGSGPGADSGDEEGERGARRPPAAWDATLGPTSVEVAPTEQAAHSRQASVARGAADGEVSGAPTRVPAAAAGAPEAAQGTGSAGPTAAQLGASLPRVARPLAAALLCAADIAVASARWLAGCGDVPATRGSLQPSASPVPRGAVRPPDAAARSSGVQGGDGSEVGLQAAYLEAAVEVLKALSQREDGGRPLAGGLDMAQWLLLGGGLLPRMLGMLAALQPAPAARDANRQQRRRRRPAAGRRRELARAAGCGAAPGAGGPLRRLPAPAALPRLPRRPGLGAGERRLRAARRRAGAAARRRAGAAAGADAPG